MSDIRITLLDALEANSTAADPHDYSALDKLIYSSRSEPAVGLALGELLREHTAEIIKASCNSSALVELFVALDLQDSLLADNLERAITTDYFVDDVAGRLTAVTLLRACGRTLPPRYIVGDRGLMDFAPLQWLDLGLPLMTDVQARQAAILSLVESGDLGVDEIKPRLHSLWAAGATDPVYFLRRVATKISSDKMSSFLALIHDAFEVDLGDPHHVQAIEERLSRNVPNRFKDALGRGMVSSDRADLEAHNRRVRQNAVIRRFPDFQEQAVA